MAVQIYNHYNGGVAINGTESGQITVSNLGESESLVSTGNFIAVTTTGTGETLEHHYGNSTPFNNTFDIPESPEQHKLSFFIHDPTGNLTTVDLAGYSQITDVTLNDINFPGAYTATLQTRSNSVVRLNSSYKVNIVLHMILHNNTHASAIFYDASVANVSAKNALKYVGDRAYPSSTAFDNLSDSYATDIFDSWRADPPITTIFNVSGTELGEDTYVADIISPP